MDREEKLVLLYVVTMFFALCFHVATTEERMAKQGYIPHHVKGVTTTYWFKPAEDTCAKQQLSSF